MQGRIIDNVRCAQLDKHTRLFRHKLKRYAQKHVLLRQVWDRSDQHTTNVVHATTVGDDIHIEEEIAACNAGDWEGFSD